MYNNTYGVSQVISNTDYLLFKKGVRPEWEDPANKQGGKWVVTLPIADDMEEDCDDAWLQLILNLLAGQFPKEQRDVINGIVFSVRDKHLRISIWTACLKTRRCSARLESKSRRSVASTRSTSSVSRNTRRP